MKLARFAVWVFGQLGARAGNELVDLYAGSGALADAWRRCTGSRRVTSDVADVAARGVASKRRACARGGAMRPGGGRS
jgi:hypothetical protein